MTELADIQSTLRMADVHTVEVAIVDTYGHLRGKRFPVDHFLRSVAEGGCHLADAIYIFDLHNDLVDSPYINMGKGFLDTHLVPDLGTLRIFGHRPGYALVFADSLERRTAFTPSHPARCWPARSRAAGRSATARSWPPRWSSTCARPTGRTPRATSSTRRSPTGQTSNRCCWPCVWR